MLRAGARPLPIGRRTQALHRRGARGPPSYLFARETSGGEHVGDQSCTTASSPTKLRQSSSRGERRHSRTTSVMMSTIAAAPPSQPAVTAAVAAGLSQQQQPSLAAAAVRREVEPDAIKMFVGQVPKTMDETDLREFFSRFGDIYQLNVLRDKVSGQSRGCCFVTFYTRKAAIESQDALHNKHVLPGMHHPIQMRPADNEKKNLEERKLFVGMISKKMSETDIRRLFAPFGVIEECTVLRDQSGVSRGCAFVTYVTRNSALLAIQSMHQSQTMEGCASPLVVKFADTPKDKEHRKVPLTTVNNNNLWSAMQLANVASLSPSYLALLQTMATGGGGTAGYLPSVGGLVDMSAYHNVQNLGLIGVPGMVGVPNLASLGRSGGALSSGGGGSQYATAVTSAVTAGVPTSAAAVAAATRMGTPLMSSKDSMYLAGLSGGLGALGGGSLSTSQLSGAPLISSSMATPASSLASLSQAAAFDTIAQACAGIAPYTASFHSAYSPPTPAQLGLTDPITGKQSEGPDGANLFIYHLPQDFNDTDLINAFAPFGNLISAKVFIDKQSNMSKCFGFVSYDSPMAAQKAIQTMNGFQIGMKRLKVQLKRTKNDRKPYW